MPNPYQPPKEDPPRKPGRWGRMCLYAFAVAALSFSIQMLIVVYQPYGVLDYYAPRTIARQRMTTVAFVNLSIFYVALAVSILAAIRWAISRLWK